MSEANAREKAREIVHKHIVNCGTNVDGGYHFDMCELLVPVIAAALESYRAEALERLHGRVMAEIKYYRADVLTDEYVREGILRFLKHHQNSIEEEMKALPTDEKGERP